MAKLLAVAKEEMGDEFNMDEGVKALDDVRELVALEALALGDLNPLKILDKVLPSISKNIRGFVGLLSSTDQAIKLPKDYKELAKILNKHDYGDLANLMVYKPAGMNKPFLDYLSSLNRGVEYSLTVSEKLADLNTLIAIVLSNAGDTTNFKSNMANYVRYEKDREQVNKDVGSNFIVNNTDARSIYSKVVARNKDWEIIVPDAQKLVFKMNSVDRRKLNKKVQETSELIDALVKQAKNGTLKGLNETILNEIAEAAYQVGREVESFVGVYHRVSEFVNLFDHTIDSLQYFTRSVGTESTPALNVFDTIVSLSRTLKELKIRGPVNPSEVKKAEKELGIQFDPSYTEYLTKIGGLSCEAMELYGLGYASNSFLNVVNATKGLVKEDYNKNYPKNAVPLENYGDGHNYLIYVMNAGVYNYNNLGRKPIELVAKSLEEHLAGSINFFISTEDNTNN